MKPSPSGRRRLRSQVVARARWRCEYCTAPQAGSAYTFHLDHILPRVEGGPTVLENLALACAPCNGAKREKVNATDPRTGKVVRLFHPRIDHWGGSLPLGCLTHTHCRSYCHRKGNSTGSALQ